MERTEMLTREQIEAQVRRIYSPLVKTVQELRATIEHYAPELFVHLDRMEFDTQVKIAREIDEREQLQSLRFDG